MLNSPSHEDVDRLKRIAQHVPHYAKLMKLLLWNHGREQERLSFWTDSRQVNYIRIMQLFEADWCFVNEFTKEYGINSSIQQLWNQLEAMAAVIGGFAEQHDQQIAREGLEDLFDTIPPNVFVPSTLTLN